MQARRQITAAAICTSPTFPYASARSRCQPALPNRISQPLHDGEVVAVGPERTGKTLCAICTSGRPCRTLSRDPLPAGIAEVDLPAGQDGEAVAVGPTSAPAGSCFAISTSPTSVCDAAKHAASRHCR